MSVAGSQLHVVVSTQRRGAEVFADDLVTELRRRDVPADLVALAALGRRPLDRSTLLALRRAGAASSVVVAHGSRTLPACTLALAGTGTPFVYRSIGDPRAWSDHGVRRARTALMLRRARIVVALWAGAAETMITRHGVPAERVRVVPNGVAAHRCPVPDDDARRSARARLDLPIDAPVVAFVGSLTTEKRVEHAIDAVARDDELHLLVVGDGPRRGELAAHAARVAPRRVHFAGVQPDIAPILAAADAVVLTSRTEGMPGVLIEAGLAARPTVAYDVGGVAEVVVDGETGLLVPAGDVTALTGALRTVVDDPGSLGAMARRRCLERFEIGVVGGQWAMILDEMAAEAT